MHTTIILEERYVQMRLRYLTFNDAFDASCFLLGDRWLILRLSLNLLADDGARLCLLRFSKDHAILCDFILSKLTLARSVFLRLIGNRFT